MWWNQRSFLSKNPITIPIKMVQAKATWFSSLLLKLKKVGGERASMAAERRIKVISLQLSLRIKSKIYHSSLELLGVIGVLSDELVRPLGFPSFSNIDSPSTELKQFIMNKANTPTGTR